LIVASNQDDIWEWRAFGTISDRTIAEVRAHPIRLGIAEKREEDLYLVSPVSDHNVKLRNASGQFLLKLKPLLAKGPRSIELYRDSVSLLYSFPVDRSVLREAARLLGVKLPEKTIATESFSKDDFIWAILASSPSVRTVSVSKSRSQFEFDGGWVELADSIFPRRKVQSLSIQSPDRNLVEQIIDELRPAGDLEVMGYIEACRRWG
jgi:hypothetical protein